MIMSLAWLCGTKGTEVPAVAPRIVWREPEGETWLMHDANPADVPSTKYRLVQVKGRVVA